MSYHVLNTAHEGFITGVCMVPSGIVHASYQKRLLPHLLAEMLGLGTKSKTEDAINTALESKGILLSISVSSHFMKVSFTCLKRDFATLVLLIAEQLQEPRFDKEAFDHLTSRFETYFESLKDDTSYLAAASLSQVLYPEGHMMRQAMPSEMLEVLKKMSLKDIQSYHAEYDPFMHAQWIVVGDVTLADVEKACDQLKTKQGQALAMARDTMLPLAVKAQKKTVKVKDKQSVDVRMGHIMALDEHHPDFLPLKLAIDALGGSFSARLMRTVRDEDGLTYNVGSAMEACVPGHHGHWFVYGSFSPALLDKGIASINKQLKLWVKEGVSQTELDERKNGMIGKYTVVGLSSASGLAMRMAQNMNQGYDLEHLYQLPEKIEAVTLDQVNQALKTYIDLDKLVTVCAGSI